MSPELCLLLISKCSGDPFVQRVGSVMAGLSLTKNCKVRNTPTAQSDQHWRCSFRQKISAPIQSCSTREIIVAVISKLASSWNQMFWVKFMFINFVVRRLLIMMDTLMFPIIPEVPDSVSTILSGKTQSFMATQTFAIINNLVGTVWSECAPCEFVFEVAKSSSCG